MSPALSENLINAHKILLKSYD
ncbi:hypothetical protein AGR4C_Cc80006 [Agrobacterium tumefaciens str. Kerr 14]|uniref:Uncharacterized protein n=4 Tax=Agrobacterium TaxID=357 RepID=A0A1S7PP47_9HYPH|nr:hypothetical protein AGR13a_Cc160106 [Agrobacterium genomosp. 13 str. CFBP 6927]CUX23726.1 hypothetical protein AGR4B_Cc61108 [Agrobacterium tumefaciens str. CFBP 5621]CUX24131.1 hypothetical protein AGR7C_Cc160237 [Agrobacterium deltaense Zutra 3/1]CUX29846.1 hypothetical protein AGR7B_Cc50120 [Agrobacterium deltaense RV3]CUX36070.1 hypothetical protein AGR4C_Cc80006 [Agrobacterium tumefaciens str. Kerr 14]CVI55658.1 hypothetical protein AGR7A_Cc210190 [Agrobacterium deltaense NCPPB 1641]